MRFYGKFVVKTIIENINKHKRVYIGAGAGYQAAVAFHFLIRFTFLKMFSFDTSSVKKKNNKNFFGDSEERRNQ